MFYPKLHILNHIKCKYAFYACNNMIMITLLVIKIKYDLL